MFTPKPVQQPIPIWVGGESGPALRRTVRYADCWYPVGTNPQFPMNTVSRLKAGLARFRGFAEKAGRDPSEFASGIAGADRPRHASAPHDRWRAEMFTGGAADYVADIRGVREAGVSAVDVRLFATIDQSMPRSTTCAGSGTGF